MKNRQLVLNYFKKQGMMTNIDKHKELMKNVKGNIYIITQIIQGILLHDGFPSKYRIKYKAGLFHFVSDILDKALENDNRSLTIPRAPKNRVQVCCRDYATLLTAILREKGIASRSRCGFAKFDINEKSWFDHWICEYWNNHEKRWIKVDAQLNPFLQLILKIDYDPYNVPDDYFIVAGKAWNMWRQEGVDPNLFGIHDLCGSWFIRGNLLRDFAAINKYEIEPYLMRINLNLTWEPWRLMTAKDDELTNDDMLLLDKIAELTINVDDNLEEIIKTFNKNKDLNL